MLQDVEAARTSDDAATDQPKDAEQPDDAEQPEADASSPMARDETEETPGSSHPALTATLHHNSRHT